MEIRSATTHGLKLTLTRVSPRDVSPASSGYGGTLRACRIDDCTKLHSIPRTALKIFQKLLSAENRNEVPPFLLNIKLK